MLIPMTATHACRGNAPIIIASSVAIHQAGVRTVANGVRRTRKVRASENSPGTAETTSARGRGRSPIRPPRLSGSKVSADATLNSLLNVQQARLPLFFDRVESMLRGKGGRARGRGMKTRHDSVNAQTRADVERYLPYAQRG